MALLICKRTLQHTLKQALKQALKLLITSIIITGCRAGQNMHSNQITFCSSNLRAFFTLSGESQNGGDSLHPMIISAILTHPTINLNSSQLGLQRLTFEDDCTLMTVPFAQSQNNRSVSFDVFQSSVNAQLKSRGWFRIKTALHMVMLKVYPKAHLAIAYVSYYRHDLSVTKSKSHVIELRAIKDAFNPNAEITPRDLEKLVIY